MLHAVLRDRSSIAAVGEGFCPECRSRLSAPVGHGWSPTSDIIAHGDCGQCCSCYVLWASTMEVWRSPHAAWPSYVMGVMER